MKLKVLDLGCGKKKLEGAFGVDFNKYAGVDLVWDLEKPLPKKFWGKFDKVYSSSILEHLGNPLNFMKNCRNYLKKGGVLELTTDNADYFRFHFEHKKITQFFGAYHATLWESQDHNLETQHKMLFQMKHLETLTKLAGFKITERKYVFANNVLDRLLPEKFGAIYLSIKAKKN
ncbi:MAG: methyltransferase domain-containing protein [Candidatus Diapherotrites archaeon]|nr:methyltransferase domain-containing protein [Candidatus Diapherotrites archaeon]